MRVPSSWSGVGVVSLVVVVFGGAVLGGAVLGGAVLGGCELSPDADGPQDVRAVEVAAREDAAAAVPDAGGADGEAPPPDPALLELDNELLAWTPPAMDEERRRPCSTCETGTGNVTLRRVRMARTVGEAADEPLLARAEALRTRVDAARCALDVPRVADDDVGFPLHVGECSGASQRYRLWQLLRSLEVVPETGEWPEDALPPCFLPPGTGACAGCEVATEVEYDASVERVAGTVVAGTLGEAQGVLAGDPAALVTDARVARVVVRGFSRRHATEIEDTLVVVYDRGGRVVLVSGISRGAFPHYIRCGQEQAG